MLYLLGFVFGLAVTCLRAWVVVCMWGWFIVPTFDVPELSFIPAIGILYLTYLINFDPTRPEVNPEDYGKLIGKQLAMTLVIWGFSWCFSLFM